MRRHIFIHLNETTQNISPNREVSWVVKGQNGNTGPVFHGDLNTASNHATGCRVVVFVSGFDTPITHVALPNMNRQRLVKAIPFALEEQMANDVEDLHFSIGQRYDSVLSCVVTEREKIDLWLAQLKDVGIQADVLCSELLGIHFGVYKDNDSITNNSNEDNEDFDIERKTQWHLLLDQHQGQTSKGLIRVGEQSGITCDSSSILFVLKSMLDNLDVDQHPGHMHLQVSAEYQQHLLNNDASQSANNTHQEPFIGDADEGDTLIQSVSGSGEDNALVNNNINKLINLEQLFQSIQALCDEYSIELHGEELTTGYLPALSDQYTDSAVINLLQGEYSRKEQFDKIFRPWRPAVAMAAVWMLFQLGLLINEYVELSSEDARIRNEIVSIYKETFPETKNIVDPKLQMERKLEELRGGGKVETDMFKMLAEAGSVLNTVQELTIKGMRYKKNNLELDLEISDLQSLDELKVRLGNEAALSVEIVSASAKEGKVESRLRLKSVAENGEA